MHPLSAFWKMHFTNQRVQLTYHPITFHQVAIHEETSRGTSHVIGKRLVEIHKVPIHGQRESQIPFLHLPEIVLSNLRLLDRKEGIGGPVLRWGVVEILPQLGLVGAQPPHPHRQGGFHLKVGIGSREQFLDFGQSFMFHDHRLSFPRKRDSREVL